MKKLFILMFVMIFLFGSVSALEFDNVGQYNSETKTMKIKNAFGLGKEIANVTLNTQQSEKLHAGYQKVSQFTINPHEDYNSIINNLKLYDKKRGLKSIQRQVDIKYLTTESFEVNDYSCSDSSFGNGTVKTDCFISGSHFEEREVWEDFNGNVKGNEPITIGLFTEVLWGDHVEWIPEIAGVEIVEWADWINLDINFTAFEVFNTTGTDYFIVPSGITEVAVLIISGAGRGGQSDGNNVRHAGGGAAGGMVFNISVPVTPSDNITVVVGTGGPFGVNEPPVNGTGSSFGAIEIAGSPGGGAGSGCGIGIGHDGPNGAGAGEFNAATCTGGTGNRTSFSNDGADSTSNTGGGAGGSDSDAVGILGGNGTIIWGLSWANGGNGTSGTGSGSGANATENTGDGGGGGFHTTGGVRGEGGKGSDGVVIVAWNAIIPIVTLEAPANNTNFTIQSVDFSCSATGDKGMRNITLQIDDLNNFTNSTPYYAFDGVDNTVITDSATTIPTTYPFTLRVIAKAGTLTGNHALIALVDKDVDTEYAKIAFKSNGKVFLTVRNTGSSDSLDSGSTYNDGLYHDIVGVFTNATYREIFIDGVSDGTDTSSTTMSANIDRISIGSLERSSPIEYFNGSIDEPRIYNTSLSPSEITSLFNQGREEILGSVAIPNLVSYWDLGKNNATDIKGSNDGTNNGAIPTINLNVQVDGLIDGDHDWTCEAFDSINQSGTTGQRLFNIDTTPNIQYGAGVPANGANITENFFEVNVTLTETFFKNLTFDLYNTNAGLNQTITFTNSTRNQNWTNLPDGNYSYNVTVWTSTGQFNFTETRNISTDTVFPLITVTSPTGDQGTFTSGLNLSLAWTASDTNLDTCQYDYEGSNTTVNCLSGPIGLIVTDSSATSLIFYANDTFGQMSFNSTSWTYSFIENDIIFNADVFETSSQFFEINLSTSLSVSAISAELNYNGTNFVSSAECDEFCLVNNTIDIPLVSSGEFENKSFFWEINIFNGTDSINVNTSATEQNVTRIHLEECGGAFTTEALNFTVYDEQNLSKIDPFLFDGDFEQWLGGGSVKRQSNFSQSSISDLDLCIAPEDETFFIDSTIEYDEAGNASEYTLRNYYFQNDTISNVSENIFMYLLQSSFSTSFILKVQDDALLPVPNVLIETNRFYPGLNEFRIVQIAKTDDLGKSVGFFETEIVDYKFIITFNTESLLETGIQKVIPESSPFTLTFNLGDPLGEPWGSQVPLDDLISTLVWDDNTGIITYTYTDSSTNLTLARLFVIQQSLVNSSADSTICDENSTLSSAILTCNVGNDSGFYTASSFITRDSVETLDLQITFQIETLSAVVGLLGLFYGWFLILIASFMFKFNEIAGIWAITIVVLMVNLIGLINFGGLFVTSIIGVAIMLTWLMSK